MATPLGNLQDISARAVHVLSIADAVLAEDTRHSRPLLQHLAVSTPLASLHAHNESSMRADIIRQLELGRRLALITDAGTPAVSDPGALLVAGVHEAGLRVLPIPGPSALATAMSAAGFLAGDAGWLFMGFLARKGSLRRDQLTQIGRHPGAVVLFESPRRVAATLGELCALNPEREVCLCRELTKRFEELRRTSVAGLVAQVAGRELLGECTLVLGPTLVAACDDLGEAEGQKMAQKLADAGLSSRDIATALTVCRRLPHRRAYQLALGCSGGPS